MPFPSIEQFAVFATSLDLMYRPERLAEAYASHRDMQPDVDRLRRLDLVYVGDVDEPGHALAFIAGTLQ